MTAVPAGASTILGEPPGCQCGAGGNGRGGAGGAAPTNRVPKSFGTVTVFPPDSTEQRPSKTATVVRVAFRSTTVSRDKALTCPPSGSATSAGSPRSADKPACTSPACNSTVGAALETRVLLA